MLNFILIGSREVTVGAMKYEVDLGSFYAVMGMKNFKYLQKNILHPQNFSKMLLQLKFPQDIH